MEYKKVANKIYLRIDPDEDIIEIIQRVCRGQKIRGAVFNGLGFCSEITLFTYRPDSGEFREHDYWGLITMASLTGNVIEASDDEVFLRATGVFSYLDEDSELVTIAGSIQKAMISYTAEIVIEIVEGGIKRRDDIIPNLPVWKF